MGRYLLTSDFALRGWLFNPYALVNTRVHTREDLSVEEFGFLTSCDGAHDIIADDTHGSLLDRYLGEGVIREYEPSITSGDDPRAQAGATPGDAESASGVASALDPSQEYHLYPCWRFNCVNWAIAGRCNFNCRHCFAARDAHPTTEEPSIVRCLELVDQIAECGIRGVRLTGGEPLLRPDFLQITERIAQRGIVLECIVTNGSLIDDGLIDELEAQGHHPQFCVSFDGIGHHDWLRGVDGAEQKTIDGIRLLKRRGLSVKVQYCLHRRNLDTLYETVEMLVDMGVDEIRLIRVAESIRWMETSAEDTLPIEDYYATALEFIEWYLDRGFAPYLDVWGVFQHMPGTNWCRIVPVSNCTDHAERTRPVCGDARRMPFIGCDGSLSLCHQIYGYQKTAGIDWGNVYETSLTQLFSDSAFTEQLLCTWAKVREHNPECEECGWRRLCNCGCRAVALATTGDILGKDMTNCAFFKSGCYDSFCSLARAHDLNVWNSMGGTAKVPVS